jgi:hypothetical protein
MALTRNVNRIDHVVISVSPQSYPGAIKKFTELLDLNFQKIERPAENVQAAVDWDAGMEIIAPMREEGFLWDRIKAGGEGQMTVVFGVDKLDAAKKKAESVGVKCLMDVGLNGDEPWFNRFVTVKETILEPVYGAGVVLGEVIPK